MTISDMQHPRWSYAVTRVLGESAFLHSAPAAGVVPSIFLGVLDHDDRSEA